MPAALAPGAMAVKERRFSQCVTTGFSRHVPFHSSYFCSPHPLFSFPSPKCKSKVSSVLHKLHRQRAPVLRSGSVGVLFPLCMKQKYGSSVLKTEMEKVVQYWDKVFPVPRLAKLICIQSHLMSLVLIPSGRTCEKRPASQSGILAVQELSHFLRTVLI